MVMEDGDDTLVVDSDVLDESAYQLIRTLKVGQSVVIGGWIRVTVTAVKGDPAGRVQLAIEQLPPPPLVVRKG